MRDRGKKPEQQRAEEYAALIGSSRDKIEALGNLSTIDAMTYKFVASSPKPKVYRFSIWYLGFPITMITSYFFENGSVERIGPTSARFPEQERHLPVGLEELRQVAQLVGDPAGNAQIAKDLLPIPLRKV